MRAACQPVLHVTCWLLLRAASLIFWRKAAALGCCPSAWQRGGGPAPHRAAGLHSGAAVQARRVCGKVEARDTSRPTSAPTCSRGAWHAWQWAHPLCYRAVLLVEVVASTYVCTAAGPPILSNSGRLVSMMTWSCQPSGCFSSCMSLSCVLHVALHTATQHSRGKGVATACGSWLGCWPDWMAPGHPYSCRFPTSVSVDVLILLLISRSFLRYVHYGYQPV
jgi:hypothetical protein